MGAAVPRVFQKKIPLYSNKADYVSWFYQVNFTLIIYILLSYKKLNCNDGKFYIIIIIIIITYLCQNMTLTICLQNFERFCSNT